MEKELLEKAIVVSELFQVHRQEIYIFGVENFGLHQAEKYQEIINQSLASLPKRFKTYPECRFLPSKNKIYRNIVLDAHLIIFKVTKSRIEVLDIIHKASSIKKIRQTKKVII